MSYVIQEEGKPVSYLANMLWEWDRYTVTRKLVWAEKFKTLREARQAIDRVRERGLDSLSLSIVRAEKSG